MVDKKKILVIDDTEAIRKMIHDCLGQQYEVLEAYDGLSGISMIEDESPDLIICDLLMPTLTGVELLEEIKENPQAKNIPLIVITASAYVSPEKMHLTKEDIVRKPFDISQMRKKVEEKLSARAREGSA